MEAGATAVAHPVVAAMNGATVSILLRLKHAVMFEDFQVCVWFLSKGGQAMMCHVEGPERSRDRVGGSLIFHVYRVTLHAKYVCWC